MGTYRKATFRMETITLHKFSHEEYWTQEYEKFNTLQRGSRNHKNTNLFNGFQRQYRFSSF